MNVNLIQIDSNIILNCLMERDSNWMMVQYSIMTDMEDGMMNMRTIMIAMVILCPIHHQTIPPFHHMMTDTPYMMVYRMIYYKSMLTMVNTITTIGIATTIEIININTIIIIIIIIMRTIDRLIMRDRTRNGIRTINLIMILRWRI